MIPALSLGEREPLLPLSTIRRVQDDLAQRKFREETPIAEN
jgi:hypothetical protein